MIHLIKKWLGLSGGLDWDALRTQGAIIVDVRTPAEFQQGHVPGSVNTPLPVIASQSSQWKKDQVIITCCASGMRSAQAASILRGKGFTRVYNGGGWRTVAARWSSAGTSAKTNQRHVA